MEILLILILIVKMIIVPYTGLFLSDKQEL